MISLRETLRRAAPVLLVVVIALALRWRHVDARLYTSDAADYARAAKASPGELYRGAHDASLPRLIALKRDPQAGAHPWDYLYRQNDGNALRHFHVPVSFYIASAVNAFGGEERAQRMATSVAGAMAGAVATGGLLCLGAPWFASLLAGVLVVTDSRFIEITTDVSPHPWYILFALSCLMLSAFALRSGSRRARVAAWAALALSIATLEFAPLLVAAFLLAAVAGRLAKLPDAHKFVPRPLLARSARTLAFLAVMLFAIWPAGVLKGGYAVSYGFNNLIIPLLRSSSYYGPAGVGIILGNFFANQETFVLLCAATALAAAMGLRRRKMPADSLLFGCYCLAAFLFGSGGRFVYPAYAAEVTVFLAPFAALLWRDAAQSAPAARRWLSHAALAIFLLACGQSTWLALRTPPKSDPLAPVVADLPGYVPATETVLVNDINDGRTYYLYLPQHRFELTVAPSTLVPRRGELESSIRYALLNTDILEPESLRRLAAEFEPLRAYPRSRAGAQTLLLRKRAPAPGTPVP